MTMTPPLMLRNVYVFDVPKKLWSPALRVRVKIRLRLSEVIQRTAC